jgi:hypothetical protein
MAQLSDSRMLRWLAFSLIPVFLEVLLAPVPFATDFSGSVVSVLDGGYHRSPERPPC